MRVHATLHAENLLLKTALSSANEQLSAKLGVSIRVGGSFSLGHALTWDEQGRLAVQVADTAEADNTLPITAAAVHTELGNIEILLQTI